MKRPEIFIGEEREEKTDQRRRDRSWILADGRKGKQSADHQHIKVPKILGRG